MSDLKERIKNAETAATTEENPIAALFKHPTADPADALATAPGLKGQGDTLRELPVGLMDEMEQPFRLYTDKKLEQMRESIVAHGIIQRIIVRPHPVDNGRYQIISGRNRRRAAILAGYTTVPCEVRILDDDEARLQMVATNLEQRDELLPSEKAWAYRIQLEALMHQGKRGVDQAHQEANDEKLENEVNPLGQNEKRTSRQSVGKLETADQVADNESGRQVQRYIRLTYLVPELLDAVDTETLGFGAGVSLSYLSADSQNVVFQYFFVDHKQKIGGNLADALRFAGEKEPITEELISRLLSPAVKAKPKPLRKVAVNMKPIRSFFPAEASAKEIEMQIIKILTEYFDGRKEKR